MMLNKRKRLFHSYRVKLPFVKKMSASWFLVFDLDFRVQVDPVKQPIMRNPVGSGHVSHRRTSAFDKSCWFPLHCLQQCKAKHHSGKVFACVITWSILNNSRSSRLECFFVLVLVCFLCSLSGNKFSCTGRFKEECNTSITDAHRSTAGIPSMRNPASKKITSDSGELCETEIWFFPHPAGGNECSTSEDTESSPDVHFESSRSPAESEIDNAVLYFPHGNSVFYHSCHGCKISNEPSVCHKRLSIVWLLVPICWRTIECRVCLFLPNTSISESIRLTCLPPCPIIPFDVTVVKAWRRDLFQMLNLFYSPIRTIFPRTSSRDLSCHKTKRLFSRAIFPNHVTFQLLGRKFAIPTSCIT